MCKKPRVVFPYTEAGLGHIMPLNSIADEFERLYGDRVEIVRSRFFSESGDKKLMAYEEHLKTSVLKYNLNPRMGHFATFNMDFWGTFFSTWGAVVFIGYGAARRGIRHMAELKPDLVVSTHWATNYYAMKMKDRPLTAMYCPDCKINTLFRYACDLTLVPTEMGYRRALEKHPSRYNKSNLKKVPFLIRKEAFEVTASKQELRRKLGLAEDRFTVLLADGGYGVGRLHDMCEEIIRRDLPINLITVCGKNEQLYAYLSSKKTKGRLIFKPLGLVDNIMEVIAACDLSCGKSGASLMAEPCFFGVPQLITHYATNIEKWIGKYYLEWVGSAIKEFDVVKAVDLIEDFAAHPEKLQPYRDAALAQRSNYGAEKSARYIFGLLCTKFPQLKDGTELYD